MKKALCILVCLFLLIPCAFAEDLPRNVGENGAGYAWLYEKSLIVAERFQRGLDCTWHSFLLSAVNVPEDEMLQALAPLRMQDYTQPLDVTIVRADQTLPNEMITEWKDAAEAEKAAREARSALISAELVNSLAIVKAAKAEEEAIELTAESVRTAQEAVNAAKEAARIATEAGEAEAAKAAEEVVQLTSETAKAAEEAARLSVELNKAEAVLAAKAAEKAAKAAEAAAKAAAEAGTDEAEPEAEKSETALAAEEAYFRAVDASIMAEKAVKAAENAVKTEENVLQAAQALKDAKAGKLAKKEEPEKTSPESDDTENTGVDMDAGIDGGTDTGDGFDLDLDFDFGGAPEDDGAAKTETPSDNDWEWDWDDWNWNGGASADTREEIKRTWFIEDDPQRDLYHSTPSILNYYQDFMFSAISDDIKVRGFYTCDEALDGPHYAVMYYGGLYALLITYYPAGDGFVSVNCQIIYSRSADDLYVPENAADEK